MVTCFFFSHAISYPVSQTHKRVRSWNSIELCTHVFLQRCLLNCMLSVLFSKNSKVQKRGKVNLIGRLQLSTEKAKQEENDGIVALRILRIQVLNVKHRLIARYVMAASKTSYNTTWWWYGKIRFFSSGI